MNGWQTLSTCIHEPYLSGVRNDGGGAISSHGMDISSHSPSASPIPGISQLACLWLRLRETISLTPCFSANAEPGRVQLARTGPREVTGNGVNDQPNRRCLQSKANRAYQPSRGEVDAMQNMVKSVKRVQGVKAESSRCVGESNRR